MMQILAKTNRILSTLVARLNQTINTGLAKFDQFFDMLGETLTTHHPQLDAYIEKDGWTVVGSCLALGALFAAIVTLYTDSGILKAFATGGLYLSTVTVALMLIGIAVKTSSSILRILFGLLAIYLVVCAMLLRAYL